MTKSGVIYRIRVSAGYDDNFTQIMKSMTYKPKPGMSQRQIKAEVNRQAVLFEEKVRQEQAEKKKRIELGLEDDFSLSAKRVKFKPLAEEWIELMETTHEMKPATIIRIKTMRERTYKAIGEVYVDVLNYRHIQKFITSLAQDGVNQHTGGGLSQKTQKHYVTFISDVLSYARTCGFITDNPCVNVKTVKTGDKEKEIYTMEELKTLLNLINEKADLQHRVMFNLLAYCGMRRGELLGLEFKDIDFENNTLVIVRTSNYQNGTTGIYTSTPKTKSSVRELFLRRPVGQQRQAVHQLARRTDAAVLSVQMAQGFLREGRSTVQRTAQLPSHSRDAVNCQRSRRVHRVRDPRTQQCLYHAEHLHPRREKSEGKGSERYGGADRRK